MKDLKRFPPCYFAQKYLGKDRWCKSLSLGWCIKPIKRPLNAVFPVYHVNNHGSNIGASSGFVRQCWYSHSSWYSVIRPHWVKTIDLPRSVTVWFWLYSCDLINTLRPKQNRRHFADDTLKRTFVNENFRNSIKMSLKFVPKGPVNNYLNQWWLVLLTHICLTRPQWVNNILYCWFTEKEKWCNPFMARVPLFYIWIWIKQKINNLYFIVPWHPVSRSLQGRKNHGWMQWLQVKVLEAIVEISKRENGGKLVWGSIKHLLPLRMNKMAVIFGRLHYPLPKPAVYHFFFNLRHCVTNTTLIIL